MTKRILQGEVVSDKTDKTIVVKVQRRFRHPFMEKLYQDLKSIMHTMKKINTKKVILLKLLNLNQYQNLKHGRYLKSDTSSNRITGC